MPAFLSCVRCICHCLPRCNDIRSWLGRHISMLIKSDFCAIVSPHTKLYRADTFRSAEFAGICKETEAHTNRSSIPTSHRNVFHRSELSWMYVEICKAHGTALFNCDGMCIIFGDFYFTAEWRTSRQPFVVAQFLFHFLRARLSCVCGRFAFVVRSSEIPGKVCNCFAIIRNVFSYEYTIKWIEKYSRGRGYSQ